MEDRFFGAKPPDYGQWCLEQAVVATDRTTASYFLAEALDPEYGGKQRRHIVEKRIVGDTVLKGIYEELQEEREEREQRSQDRYEQAQKKREARKNQIQRERHGQFKPHESALRENEAPPPLLHTLAQAYSGGFVDIRGDTPRARLENLFGDDDDLIAAVLEGFRGAIARSDVPTEAEILDLSNRNRTHYLALPILAGLEEAVQKAPNGALFPDEKRMRLALAIHYTAPTPLGAERSPNWFSRLLASHPRAVADVLIRTATSMMRSGADFVSGLHDLLSDDHAAVARLASIPLLKALPVRCRSSQLQILRILLGAALLQSEVTQVLELIDNKLAHRSMNVAQRVHWLAAGLLASPDTYLGMLQSYVAGNERRVRYVAEAVTSLPLPLIQHFDVPALRILIHLIGGSYRPFSHYLKSDGSDSEEGGAVTPAMFAGSSVEAYINQLAAIPSALAADALEELSSDDNLRAWQSLLIDAAYRQNEAHREADFEHCNVEQAIAVLDNGKLANAADLAALSFEYLREISKNIRDGNTSDWRQYWDSKSRYQLGDPRPEDLCRDALLSDLQNRLKPLDIDAQAEVRHADDKRSDIRVSFAGFNVPVEIKKSCSRDLWSAIGTQLIAKYTRDPGTDGHGIYLVFWFGNTEHCRPTPGEGTRPKSAVDLEERLRDTLSPGQMRKILISVIDVSEPETRNIRN